MKSHHNGNTRKHIITVTHEITS